MQVSHLRTALPAAATVLATAAEATAVEVVRPPTLRLVFATSSASFIVGWEFALSKDHSHPFSKQYHQRTQEVHSSTTLYYVCYDNYQPSPNQGHADGRSGKV